MTDFFSTTELVGYLASLGVLISFLMKEMKMLRAVNIIGCSLFIVYGILLEYSFPVIITNVSIVLINIYYLLNPKLNG